MAAILDSYGRPARRPSRKEIAAGYGRLQIMEGLEEWANPDDVAREDGLVTYDDVAKDLHTKSVWNTRILALKGCSREWHAPEGDDADSLPLRFLEWTFQEAMQRSLSSIYEQVHRSGTKNGFAVQELMWQPNYPRGEFRGATALVDIRDRDSDRFIIKQDGLYLKEHWADQDGKKCDPRKFWIVPYQAEYENPYGTSLFQEVKWYVWFKKNGFKFWLVFLEKFGMPTVKGVIPENYTDEDEIDRVREVLRTIRGREAITVPAGFEVELLEASKTGSAGTGYDLLIGVCNREISKGILGQTLTTEEGQKSGSYAQSKVHNTVRSDILIADGEWLDNAINFGPVVTLLDYNFRLDRYPRIKTETEPGEDLNALAERDKKLVECGVRIPQRYFYETYNIPEPQDGEAVAGAQAAIPSVPSDGTRPPSPERFAEHQKKTVPTDDLVETALKEGAARFDAALLTPIREQAQEILTAGEIPTGLTQPEDFAAYLADTLTTAAVLGRWVMQQRIQPPPPVPLPKDEGRTAEGFAEGDDLGIEILGEPLANMDALKFVQDKQIMSSDEFRALSAAAKDAAFTVSRVEDERLLADIKEELEAALEDGSTVDKFLDRVNEACESRGIDPLRPWHLETIFRTNVQSAYHAAGWQMLHDPELGDLVTYLQYDAIDDHRTRPAHAAVDGVILPIDDAFWDRWYPPNGYRCRCDVIPITKYEAGSYTKTASVPDVNPDEGFDSSPQIGGHE